MKTTLAGGPLLGLALLLSAEPCAAQGSDADYRVVWDAAAFPRASVTATLRSPDCTFGTSRRWATFFEDERGWSQFLSGLSATNVSGSGENLPVLALKEGRFRAGEGGPCRVKLSYTVDFAFGRKSWSAGNEQVAYTDDRAISTTGLPLFLLGEDGPATITVEKPRDWAFATPWEETGTRSTYRVPNQDALLSNTLVVGRTYTETFTAGSFHVTAALLGDLASGSGALRAAFSKIAPAAVALFGDKREGRYMFVLIPGPEDGESFRDSFTVSTVAAPDAGNRIIWANHLAHELLHYWIGHAIAPPADRSGELKWFTEGFTEYFANALLASTGVYTDADLLERLSRHFGSYLLTRQNPFFMETSLQAAGAKGWHNRPLIYSGGASLAFCLDARIRARSKGGKRLSDVMPRLLERALSGERLSDSVLRNELSDLAGEDLSAFFADHVSGTKPLPLEACAAQAGLEARIQGYDVFLRRAPRASTGAR